MVKFLLLIAVLTFSIEKAQACSYPVKDTSTNPSAYNYKQFLAKFSTDDTAIALINYWFGRRSAAKYISAAGVVTAGMSAIGLSGVKGDSLGNVASKGAFALGIFVGGLMLLLFGSKFLFSSRKKLVRLLQDYKDGKPFSKKIKRKIANRIKPQSN